MINVLINELIEDEDIDISMGDVIINKNNQLSPDEFVLLMCKQEYNSLIQKEPYVVSYNGEKKFEANNLNDFFEKLQKANDEHGKWPLSST